MLYTDTLFLLLFAALWVVTRALRPWPVVKEWLLIGFSLLVIASWGYFDLALFLAVLAVNFVGARLVATLEPARSRGVLGLFIALDVGTLAVFKYGDFIGGNLGALSGWKVPAFPLGIPLAISFYTFHLISYLVDLQARRVRLASVREYLFYLSFFPHVIAGPIVRAWQLVPQIGHRRRVRNDLLMGFHFLVTGYFLKMVVANNVGALIDPWWKNAAGLSALEHWLLAFLYYCQIYADFAGYSLMALGMSRLLGYRLPANFRSPMRAATIQEFWQRWHITLSRWLRDYLYIPLGGNRVSPAQSARNVMVTMLLGGLWHGAGWGFVLWGAMHGAGIVTERALGFTRNGTRSLGRFGWAVLAQLWITAAWVFFRAPSVPVAFRFLRRMFDSHLHHALHVQASFGAGLLLAVPVVLHHLFPPLMRAMSRRSLPWLLGASTGVMLMLNLITFSPSTVFIYFRF